MLRHSVFCILSAAAYLCTDFYTSTLAAQDTTTQSTTKPASAASRRVMKLPETVQFAVRPEAGKEPKLVFERELYDFGTVDEGPELQATFPFRNDGIGDLVFVDMAPHCGEFEIQIEAGGKFYNWNTPIPPGGRGVVRFFMSTVGRLKSTCAHVDLSSNDPTPRVACSNSEPGDPAKFGIVSLRAWATIAPRFEFVADNNADNNKDADNNKIDLGTISGGGSNEGFTLLKSARDEPFQIVGFEGDDPLLEMRAEAIDGNATTWRISATLSGGPKYGPFSRFIKILTCPKATIEHLHVTGTVLGPVGLDSRLVAFGRIQKDRASVQRLGVRKNYSTHQLKIENLRILPPSATSSPASRPEPNAHEYLKHLKAEVKDFPVNSYSPENREGPCIEVTVDDTMPVGVFGAILVFNTGIPGANDNGSDEMRIPISGCVQ